ncbi:MAG: type II secretion system F family protein [Clostridia bacterium]|nr:type II secretion system F family protein [Clostridia bacterium]
MKKYLNKLKNSCSFVYGAQKGVLIFKVFCAVKICLWLIALTVVIYQIVFYDSPIIQSAVLGLFIAVICTVFTDMIIYSKEKTKKENINLGLADFMEQTALLLETGMHLWKAIAETACRWDENNAFTNEIMLAVKSYSLKEGYFSGSEEAMYAMADRCGTVMVSSFVATVVQNSRKGSSEIALILKTQASVYRTERRAIAKKHAEEASTLMLLPTSIVFLAVIALVTAPAVLTLISGML